MSVGETRATVEARHVRLPAVSQNRPPITPYQSRPLFLPPKPKQVRKKVDAGKAKDRKGAAANTLGSGVLAEGSKERSVPM
jgi:hypothetical protein